MSKTHAMGPLQWAIILLTVATAAIHLVLGLQFAGGIDPIFILNGIGYLGLVALLYLPIPALERYRGIIRWVLIAYTAVTVLAWVQIGVRSPTAYIDKTIEIALILCLWVDGLRSSR